MIIALRFNSGGRREVLGTDIDPSEAETFSTAFLHKLVRRSAGLLMLFLNIKGRRLALVRFNGIHRGPEDGTTV